MGYQELTSAYCWITILFLFKILTLSVSAANIKNNNIITREPKIFQTKSGPVQGIVTKSEDDNDINVFYGIPYAQPPMGELRFRAPVKVKAWNSVLQATTRTQACYQQLPKAPGPFESVPNGPQRPWSENCLHLNIWAPAGTSQKYPVIFFIHGGGFVAGSGSLSTDGTSLASNGLVVVTINYRLGVFGFFSLGIDEAPGNMGLMDQNLALQWVHENIEVFGGNPELITLLGGSAGSASVGHQILSPQSRGLFKRAVLMSGVPISYWATMELEVMVEKSNNVLQMLGCQLPDTTASLLCVKQKHPEDIVEVVRTNSFYSLDNFVPTVDGKFVTKHPKISLLDGSFTPVDLLMGTTADEGADFVLAFNPDVFSTRDGRLYARDFHKVIQRAPPRFTSVQAVALDVIYANSSYPEDPYMLRNAAMNIYSDAFFNCDVNEFSETFAKTESSVYRYIFDYKLPSEIWESPKWSGATHGQDMLPIFSPADILKQSLQPKALEVLTRFRKHIENFAKNGNPNLNKKDFPGDPEWPKYDTKYRFLNFAEESSVHPMIRQKECAARNRLLPILREKTC